MTKHKSLNNDIIALVSRGINLLKEKRLPWRVSQWISKQHLNALRIHYDHKVLSTRPFLTGGKFPHFELHMLLGHQHVGMCLWSIKSFLHYANIPFIVVLHDDGSLTKSDILRLKEHLVNAKVIRKLDADDLIKEKLTHLSNCLEYRFTFKKTSDHRGTKYNVRIFSLRLFDFNLISSASKILVLDADVLFFKEPREIIEWAIEPGDNNSLYSVEQYLPVRNIKNEIIEFKRKAPTPTAANAGLLCFDKRAFDLDTIDNWIGSRKGSIDMHATFEQATYNHLIKKKGGSSSLPDTYSFNYTDENVIATHFAIKILFFQNLNRLSKVLS